MLDGSPSGESGSKRIADNNSHIYDLKEDKLQLTVFFRTYTVEEKEELLRKAVETQSKDEKRELD